MGKRKYMYLTMLVLTGGLVATSSTAIAQTVQAKPRPPRPAPVRPKPRPAAIPITGYAPVSCVYTTYGNPRAINRNGTFDLGPVREVCNSLNPYSVTVNFGNVAQGYLVADGQAYPISYGQLTYTTSFRGSRMSRWQLRGLSLVNPSQPVQMTISIVGPY